MKIHFATAMLCAALLPLAAAAAPPDVPETVSYQGVLLDSGGLPRTGSVDLVLRIFDAATGGTLVYKQEFFGVALTDGVFQIELGPSGASTDSPVDPLTTDLATALGGDAGATSPHRFLEVTVGLEGALTRTQVLAVPYALRASSADNAASADVALQVANVAGLPPEVVSQIYEHTNLDGEGEGNAGPTEGFGDSDGDGAANFVDPDNDDDGVLDGAELAAGTDPNLVTPRIATLAPLQTFSDEPATFQVTGSNFDATMTATLGAEVLTVSNLTPTSFDADSVGQAVGTVPFRVELPNLESDERDVLLVLRLPIIDALVPSSSSAGFPVTVTVQGQNFVPGLTVQFEGQTPVPQSLTGTSFQVDLTGEPLGTYPLNVTLPNGQSTSADFTFDLQLGPHGLSVDPQTQLSVAATATVFVVGAEDEYGVSLGPPVAFPSEGGIAMAFDATEALAGLRCRNTAPGECTVELAIDTDADFDLSDESPTTIEVIAGSAPAIGSPSLAFDASGRPVAGYLRSEDAATVAAVVAHDRDGNGDFAGTNEHVVIEPVSGLALDKGKVTVDSTGQVAFAYGSDTASSAVRVARDRNGDGDFEDVVGANPEVLSLPGAPTALLNCVSAAFDASDRLWVLRSRTTTGLFRSVDTNGDGDFEDFQEGVTLTGPPTPACDVANGAGVLHVAYSPSLTLLRDLNGDLDFADPDEDVVVNSTSFDGVAVTADPNGNSILVADDQAAPVAP